MNAKQWNAKYPIGTEVVVWDGRRNNGQRSETICAAVDNVLGSVVMVASQPGFFELDSLFVRATP